MSVNRHRQWNCQGVLHDSIKSPGWPRDESSICLNPVWRVGCGGTRSELERSEGERSEAEDQPIQPNAQCYVYPRQSPPQVPCPPSQCYVYGPRHKYQRRKNASRVSLRSPNAEESSSSPSYSRTASSLKSERDYCK